MARPGGATTQTGTLLSRESSPHLSLSLLSEAPHVIHGASRGRSEYDSVRIQGNPQFKEKIYMHVTISI